ncbi:uncharacterized protein LOC128960190 [Oppia nitens]|uniref:uncharacterized protein LOC128960190 n=1 Tax=Oppia nitens TaxID=1686743 RepID=UPI0023D9AA5E|nr:uncharacterized protein LOC128960190 [Oppia nitens]
MIDTKNLVFIYPRYETPFVVSINPNYSKWMDRYCTQWAVDNCGQMGQHNRYRRAIENSDCGLFAAVTYPGANWHRCEKLMKWSLIFFICDDYHDICIDGNGHQIQCQLFWHELSEALDTFLMPRYYSRQEWPVFVRAVQQILREIFFDYSPQQIERSVNAIKNYITGNVGESEWTDHSINWDNYLQARLGSVGGHMALQFIEYAKNIELKDREWNHPFIQLLNRFVSEEIILINDYYTFRKEVQENNDNFYQMRHPFALFVTNDGMTLQEAVDKVYEMIVHKDKQIIAQIDAIKRCDQLRQGLAVKEYINGVNEFLGGYWRHAVTARRYHGLIFNQVLPPEGQFIYDSNKTIIKSIDEKHIHYNWLKSVPDNVQV